MNITTVKVDTGEYDVLVNGERFDTITRHGKRWLAHGDSTVIAGTLSKALDGVVWNAITQMHSTVRHLMNRRAYFNTRGNVYMMDMFTNRAHETALSLFDKIRPGVK